MFVCIAYRRYLVVGTVTANKAPALCFRAAWLPHCRLPGCCRRLLFLFHARGHDCRSVPTVQRPQLAQVLSRTRPGPALAQEPRSFRLPSRVTSNSADVISSLDAAVCNVDMSLQFRCYTTASSQHRDFSSSSSPITSGLKYSTVE